MGTRTGIWKAFTLLIALGLVPAACGPGPPEETAEPLPEAEVAEAGNDGPPEDGEPEVIELRVGTLPFAGNAPFWRAAEAGHYSDQGLAVEFANVPSDSLAIASIESGELHFAITNVMNVVMAREAGATVVLVMVPLYASSEYPDRGVFAVDPTIRAPADLTGRTVACSNTPFDTNWLTLREWLRGEDVEPDEIECTELPYFEMLTALEAGTVDAIAVIEPFYTMAQERGHTLVGEFLAEVQDDVSILGIMAKASYVEENEPVVEGFVAAMNAAIEDLSADPGLVPDLIKDNTQTAPDIVDRMVLPLWRTWLPPESLEVWGRLAVGEGLLSRAPPAEELLWSGVRLED